MQLCSEEITEACNTPSLPLPPDTRKALRSTEEKDT